MGEQTRVILKSEECNYWCVQCNRPCCDSCLIDPTHHANHETIRLSETQEKFETQRHTMPLISVVSPSVTERLTIGNISTPKYARTLGGSHIRLCHLAIGWRTYYFTCKVLQSNVVQPISK